MKCPYCNKGTTDMPNHLKKYKICHERHMEKLKLSFRESLQHILKRYENEK